MPSVQVLYSRVNDVQVVWPHMLGSIDSELYILLAIYRAILHCYIEIIYLIKIE